MGRRGTHPPHAYEHLLVGWFAGVEERSRRTPAPAPTAASTCSQGDSGAMPRHPPLPTARQAPPPPPPPTSTAPRIAAASNCSRGGNGERLGRGTAIKQDGEGTGRAQTQQTRSKRRRRRRRRKKGPKRRQRLLGRRYFFFILIFFLWLTIFIMTTTTTTSTHPPTLPRQLPPRATARGVETRSRRR
jgi:hypothetical protein